ncbi:MAG TPA: tetratricopeptide repeat protein [Pirellulales bacterium]|nr:tetratricopeptide repeat protein [Pirellulales bacterium]
MKTSTNNTAGRRSLKLMPFVALICGCLFHGTPAQAGDNCYFNWALQWDSQGNYDKAIADYNCAIEICPDDAVAYNNRGYDWYMKGDFDKAIADYNQALAICPRDGAYYSNRGVAWNDKGDLDKAMADYNQALAVDPNTASAYNNLGCIESARGEYEKAKDDFYRCLSADPNYVAGLENLGFFQATCPDPKYRDGKKAFENASLGYQLDNGADPYSSHNALAAAYAESGDFAKAAAWQEQVVQLAPAKDKTMQTARLELFKQHQPYRSKQYTELTKQTQNAN